MKIYSIFKTGVALLSIVLFLTACPTNKIAPSGECYYDINGQTFTGLGANNTTLKAIEVACNNNNTLRMYYSDSVATRGFPVLLNVVAYNRAGKLGYNECYFEVVTSATDTYLSPGTNKSFVDVTGGGQFFDFKNVSVQHFTSVPLDEFSTIEGHLQLNK
ncbi:MAG: hypothetical protein ACXVA2_09445 [Mucilaginibacter sp.]